MARLAVVKQIEQTNDMARHEQPPAGVFSVAQTSAVFAAGYEGQGNFFSGPRFKPALFPSSCAGVIFFPARWHGELPA